MRGHAGSHWDQPDDQTTLISDEEIVRDLPAAYFAARPDWAEAHRETLTRTLAAILDAGLWLDSSMEHRREAQTAILETFSGHLSPEARARMEARGIANVGGITFGENGSSAPDHATALWILSQMARWGYLPAGLTDDDFRAIADTTLRPDLFHEALERSELASGSPIRPRRDATIEHVIDGNHFHPKQPTRYLRGAP